MNKKKIASLALAVTLFASAGAYGTYAWLTSKIEAGTVAEGTITIGSLKIELVNKDFVGGSEGTHILTGYSKNNPDDQNFNTDSFYELVPGDYFVKDVVIKNTGSVDSNLTVDPNLIIDREGLNKDVKIEFLEDASLDYNKIYLGAGEEVTVGQVKISIDKDNDNLDGANTPIKYSVKLNAHAIQSNAK